MMASKVFWQQHWVEALVMLPTCIFFAILIAKLNLLLWFLAAFFAHYTLRLAYNYVVVEKRLLQSRATHFQCSIIFFVFQLLIFSCWVLLSSINP